MSREVSPAEQLLAKCLAHTIKRRRLQLGLTQEHVAYTAGIDRNHYQNIEAGISDRKTRYPLNPQLLTLVKIANVLEIEVTELLSDPLALYQHASHKLTEDTTATPKPLKRPPQPR